MIEIEVIRPPSVLVRIDLIPDSVQSCHEDGGIGIIRICCGIRVAQFKPLGLRFLGISRNTDDSTSVRCCISDGHRRFITGYEAFERVGGGVGKRAQGRNMSEQTADKIVRCIASARISVFVVENGSPVLHEQHMHVHTFPASL